MPPSKQQELEEAVVALLVERGALSSGAIDAALGSMASLATLRRTRSRLVDSGRIVYEGSKTTRTTVFRLSGSVERLKRNVERLGRKTGPLSGSVERFADASRAETVSSPSFSLENKEDSSSSDSLVSIERLSGSVERFDLPLSGSTVGGSDALAAESFRDLAATVRELSATVARLVGGRAAREAVPGAPEPAPDLAAKIDRAARQRLRERLAAVSADKAAPLESEAGWLHKTREALARDLDDMERVLARADLYDAVEAKRASAESRLSEDREAKRASAIARRERENAAMRKVK